MELYYNMIGLNMNYLLTSDSFTFSPKTRLCTSIPQTSKRV